MDSALILLATLSAMAIAAAAGYSIGHARGQIQRRAHQDADGSYRLLCPESGCQTVAVGRKQSDVILAIREHLEGHP